MALQVWLPLNGTLDNYGLSEISVSSTGATVDNSGKTGKCYSFDGNDYLSTADYTNLGSEYSFTAWIYTTKNDSYGTVVCSRSAASYGFAVFLRNNGKIRIDTTTDAVTWTTDYSYPINTWFHLAVTCDGSLTSYYINGEFKKSRSIAQDLTHYGSVITIGCSNVNGGTLSNYLAGKLNDLRIYDHCLSAKEVKEISKALVLHYPLNDFIGNENLLASEYLINGFAGQTTASAEGQFWATGVYNETQLRSMLTAGGVYRFSYDVELTAKTDVPTVYQKQVGFLLYSPGTSSANRYAYATNSNIANIGDKTHVSATWTMPSTIPSDYRLLAYTNRYTTNGSSPVGFDTCKFTNIKLELGAVETPWLPNPADDLYSDLGLDSGIVYDTSGYGRNGTVSGTINYTRTVPRYAYGIDSAPSTTDAITVTIPELSSLLANGSVYSFACWIKYTGLASTNSWVVKLGSNTCGLWFGYSPARFVWNENNNGRRCINSDDSGDPDTWHHLVVTIDKSVEGAITERNYLDGEPSPGYETQTWDSSSHVQPAGTDISIRPATSSLCDLRLYMTLLSPEDVKALYNTVSSVDKNGNSFAYELIEE